MDTTADPNKPQTTTDWSNPLPVQDKPAPPPPPPSNSANFFTESSTPPVTTTPPPEPPASPPPPPVEPFTVNGGAPPPEEKKSSRKKLVAGLVALFLVIALPVAFYLAQNQQDIRQRADVYDDCVTQCVQQGGTVDTCVVQCNVPTTCTSSGSCNGLAVGSSCTLSGTTGTCLRVNGSNCACHIPSGGCNNNGTCDANESTSSCPNDCEQTGTSIPCQTTANCQSGYICINAYGGGKYCVRSQASTCGNTTCDINETVASCPLDCAGVVTDCTFTNQCGPGLACKSNVCVNVGQSCGNNICESGENKLNCSKDCGFDGTLPCGTGGTCPAGLVCSATRNICIIAGTDDGVAPPPTGGEPNPGGVGECANGVCQCSASSGSCIAIHRCSSLDSNGWCVNTTPELRTGAQCANSVDAQALANLECQCVQVDVLDGSGTTCTTGHFDNGDSSSLLGAAVACPNITCNVPGSPAPTPPGSPGPSPTPGTSATPAPGAQCTNVKVYQVTGAVTDPGSWVQLGSAEMSGLEAGDVVYISVVGSTDTSSTQITRGRIRVNTTTWTPSNETPLLKPKGNFPEADEYYIIYTIPTGTTNFTIGAEVYSPQFDTDGDPSTGHNGWR